MNKKLLVITPRFWPENMRINYIVQKLSEDGFQITVLTGLPNYPSGKIDGDFKKHKKDYSRLNDIEIVRCFEIPRKQSKFFLALNYLSTWISYKRKIKSLLKLDFDLILFN